MIEKETEVLFYHLERAPLEKVLPELLEKTLLKGWRAVVQASSDERVQDINNLLWTYKEDSFLPHGSEEDGQAEEQPIFITTTPGNPNKADVRFLVDGASLDDLTEYQRAVFMFDGHDKQAVKNARTQWKAVTGAGHKATYWQQNRQGRWEKKA